MIKWLGCLIYCFFVVYNLSGQVFDESSQNFGVEHQYYGNYYGGGVSFYDFNNDGWDDLSLPSGEGLSKFYLNIDGSLEEIVLLDDLNEVKSLIWVDYDNDGDPDLSVTEINGFIRLFKNTGDLTLTEVNLNDSLNVETYNSGISWADYDGDGLLDFYVSRYPEHDEFFNLQNVTNMLYKQQADGSFLNVTGALEMGNGIQQSFISTWADFDNDLDVDLYIANDRFSFENAMYLNNGDGTFIDFTEESEANISVFSMTSTVGDYDNDGDLDIYSSNGFGGNHLLNNDGNAVFENQFPNSGTEAFAFSWGANWVDFDNDGWKDLFLCTSENNTDPSNRLFENNQDGSFTSLGGFSNAELGAAHGVAKGDINNDGSYDLMVTYEAPYPSQLLLNNNSFNNNYVKIKLQGTLSNRDAIGSMITYYTDGELKMEYTTCGSDYLSQDSQTKILGIGQSMEIDSLQIRWPSGLVDWHYLISADSTLCAIENSEFSTTIESSSSLQICEGEEITLSVENNSSNVTWSNETIGATATIQEPGEYWATVSLSDFFSYQTDTVIVIASPELIIDSVISQEPLCFGDSNGTIEIQYSSETESVVENLIITDLSSGNYFYELVMENHCAQIVNVELEEPSELFVLSSTQDASCYYLHDGAVVFTGFGGVGNYEFSILPEFNLDSLPAGFYSFLGVDENGCAFQDDFEINSPDLLVFELNTQDAAEGIDGSVILNILTDHAIELVTVLDINNQEQDQQNLAAGHYSIHITDEFGCEYSESFEILFITSIIEVSHSLLALYPNPSKGIVHLDSDHSSQFMLFSLDGKLVAAENYEYHDTYFDFSRLPKGAYLLKSLSNDFSKSALLILE